MEPHEQLVIIKAGEELWPVLIAYLCPGGHANTVALVTLMSHTGAETLDELLELLAEG